MILCLNETVQQEIGYVQEVVHNHRVANDVNNKKKTEDDQSEVSVVNEAEVVVEIGLVNSKSFEKKQKNKSISVNIMIFFYLVRRVAVIMHVVQDHEIVHEEIVHKNVPEVPFMKNPKNHKKNEHHAMIQVMLKHLI